MRSLCHAVTILWGAAIQMYAKKILHFTSTFYKDDAKGNNNSDKFTVDLQKVVILPRKPDIKTIYNETFALLGTKTQNAKKQNPYAVTWYKETAKSCW